jgi:hypothetical protein
MSPDDVNDEGEEMRLNSDDEAQYWDREELLSEGEVEGDDELVVDPNTGTVVAREEWEETQENG